MSPFPISELTIAGFHNALRQQQTTCAAVVRAYLARIAEYDHTLKAILCLNPDAERLATQKDTETTELLKRNEPFPRLHGVPIVLKDNFGTFGLPTTAGTKALANMRTREDSDVVAQLLRAGAIILGKTNLHEFAMHGTTVSSLGGQTLNPYDLSRTPGGSSGGTGAALAANLALVGTGTDTNNSLRSPASACAIVGFKPTWGVVPLRGIVPVSETQDCAGPMARTVEDVRVVFDVMRGETQTQTQTQNYSRSSGRKLRIGILDAYFGVEEKDHEGTELQVENAEIQSTVRKALASFQEENKETVTLVPIAASSHEDWSFANLRENADTQCFEFKFCLDEFLQSPLIEHSDHRSLASVADSGNYDKQAVTAPFDAALKDPVTFSRTSEAYRARLQRIKVLKEEVQRVFDDNQLDVLAYPHQRRLVVPTGGTPQAGRNGILAALTGRPAICLPAGFSSPSTSAPKGVPIGLEFLGFEHRDDELLDLAARVEDVLRARKEPDMNVV
ncbi:hypothetical protein N7510_001552 [Penicillium lagena]|uniref:uncharacterized protein n=1 Tax=Penicillium lagena TaxID=94218 RepID=UPI002540721A|nr:uncharacterized protein N7510_001552 [Penicillium lagena]KAJ5625243.1 hypothetical protein N7510_001552 [Penicillium lagena]